jgi:hypothetical protein
MKLWWIRKTKYWFTRLRLHVVVMPFSGAMQQLLWLARMSRWVARKPKLAYDDFPGGKWNYLKRYPYFGFLRGRLDASVPLLYLEFGVAQGHSFKWWLAHDTHAASRFHGFDTFEGLPEDWGDLKKGAMTTGSKLPDVSDPRATFHKGMFQDTLPSVLSTLRRDDMRMVAHMDADLYSSTLYALTALAPHLRSGDLVLFDEFFVPTHEYRAYEEFLQAYRITLEPIAAANNYCFVAFQVR